jgi:NitT/TauT family transport system permease protein
VDLFGRKYNQRKQNLNNSCKKNLWSELVNSRFFGTVLCVAIVLAVWQALSLFVGAAYILPTPLDTLLRATQLFATLDFWRAVAFSILRVTLGFLAGVIFGIALAVLAVAFPLIHNVISPLVRVMRTVPVVCFILLMLLWINSSVLSTCVSALMVFPVVWTGTVDALNNIDPWVVELADVCGMSAPKRLFKLYLPAIAPQLLSILVVAIGLAWKSGITAEVLALPFAGMGTSVYQAKIALEAADIFVWAAVVAAISWGMEKLLKILVSRKTPSKMTAK